MVEWLPGPPDTRQRGAPGWVPACVRELQSRPGQWADVRAYVNPNSARDAVRRLRARGCEASSSYTTAGMLWHVNARWPEG